MTANNLLDPLQSAYRKGHSTETAQVHVINDVLVAIDKGSGVIILMIDLSAAFDTVDHDIFISFLRDHIGLDDAALNLINSYLSDRSQQVSVKGILSELRELVCGVPQGSVLGPIEFCIYTLPLGAILRFHKINDHIYADDSTLYC